MSMVKKSKLMKKKNYYGFVFIAPWFIGVVLFFLYPLVDSFIFSLSKIVFEHTDGVGYTTSFTGIANYVAALRTDENFVQYLYQAIGDFFINVPIILIFSFFVAVLLKQKFKGNYLVKTIFFLPVILGAGVFLKIQGTTGAVSNATIESAKQEGVQAIQILKSINIIEILKSIGFPNVLVQYLTGPIDRIYSIISQSGVQIFIFLAGLNSIPNTLYEASYIEGASGWETFWKITFPMVSPIIIVNSVYSIVDSFTASNNKPMNYIYDVTFLKVDFGLSSAMAWIYCIIMSVIIGLTMYFVSKKAFYQV